MTLASYYKNKNNILIFAHPGMQECSALIKEIRENNPNVKISIISHVYIPEKELEGLHLHKTFILDRRKVSGIGSLIKLGMSILREIRRSKFDLFLLWYRGHTLKFLFEMFALCTGIRSVMWDDKSGEIISVHWGRPLFRIPEVIGKNLFWHAVLLLLYLYALIDMGRSNPPRKSSLAYRKLLFLRTDIELAYDNVTVGGSVSHVKGIVNAFHELGNEITAIGTGHIEGIRAESSLVASPWIIRDIPREMVELIASLAVYRKAKRYLKGSRLDFIYQRYSMYNFSGVWLSRKYKIPLVLEANNSEVSMRLQFSRMTYPKLGKVMERWILSKADEIVSVAKITKETFVGMGLDGDKIQVIPNGADPKVFYPKPKDETLIKRYGLQNKLIVGFIGCFYPWHGLEYLCRAIPEAVGEQPDLHFLFVGDGDERPKLQDILDKNGMSGQVTFTGFVNHAEIPDYLSIMDIVVSPHAPWKEFFGSPIKLFEYMSAGKPVVASAVGQIAEVIQNGYNGILVTPGDIKELVNGVVLLAGKESLRVELSSHARQTILDRYSWTSHANKIMEFLREESAP